MARAPFQSVGLVSEVLRPSPLAGFFARHRLARRDHGRRLERCDL